MPRVYPGWTAKTERPDRQAFKEFRAFVARKALRGSKEQQVRKALVVSLGALAVAVPLVLWVLPDLLDQRVRKAQQAKWDYPDPKESRDRSVQQAQVYRDRLARLAPLEHRGHKANQVLRAQSGQWDL